MPNCNHILITGVPAVGKTTLVKRIADIIKAKHSDLVRTKGFYTQEVRSGGSRIGFDVIDINDIHNRGVLSRVSDSSAKSVPKVGKYSVDVHSFETIALPILSDAFSQSQLSSHDKCDTITLIIVDEIGKMEMFSDKFKRMIQQLFESNSVRIMATIPIQQNLEFVQNLRKRSDSHEVTVERTNRDSLCDDIVRMICETALK